MESTIFIIVAVLTGLFMVAGLVGSFLPFMPGTPLIFLGALLYGWVTDFTEINLSVLVALGVIALLATLFSYLAAALGTKKLGGSIWGVIGVILGVILGIFVGGLVGLVVFPFAFAVIFELLAGATFKKSLKAGLGGLIGIFGNAVVQFFLALTMITIFLIALI